MSPKTRLTIFSANMIKILYYPQLPTLLYFSNKLITFCIL